MNSSATTEIKSEGQPGSRSFSLRERILLTLISWTAVLLIRLIGPTLRFKAIPEEGCPADGSRQAPLAIYCFWHRCLIPAAYRFRNLQIGIMISRSFDGECVARVAEMLGFRPVRGSSSRGAVGALLGMRQELEAGHPTVFTVDGPRGPMYVAKPGPVVLAKNTGCKIVCFHAAVERAWVLKSWDRMMIPKPFSRVVLYGSSPLEVPADTSDVEIEAYRQQLQAALDRCVAGAEKGF